MNHPEPSVPLLSVRNVSKRYGDRVALQGASFDLWPGEVLAVVGESGSGKSVTAMSILRLIPNPPGRISAGEVVFDGRDLLKLEDHEIRAIRGNRIAMIFQDPSSCLNPVHRIGRQLVEALGLHRNLAGHAAEAEALRLLDQVGIADARRRLSDYPHLLS
eukprot:gene8573-10916_t